MKYITFVFLFVYTFCTSKMSKMEAPTKVADIYKGLKSKIYKCVLESNVISNELKELATKNQNADESEPLMFQSIQLTRDDRITIRDCKRAAIRSVK